MKIILKTLFLLLFSFFMQSFTHLYGQSAVYVYKDAISGKGDYWFVYNAPREDANQLARNKLIEEGYHEEQIEKYADTDRKGYGIIIKSVYINKEGNTVEVFGAAVGHRSYAEAEKHAVQNLKKHNSQWNTQQTYTVVERFADTTR